MRENRYLPMDDDYESANERKLTPMFVVMAQQGVVFVREVREKCEGASA